MESEINNQAYFTKLNDLYLKVLNINRCMLDGKPGDFLAKNCQDREIKVFFGALDITLIVLIDRVRRIKLEIFDSIPEFQKLFLNNNEAREKLSELVYEYIFSGLSICFLDNIIKNDCKIYHLSATIMPDLVWEIFSQKTMEFKIPDMHGFLNDRKNSDIASIFNLMFDSMYDRLKLQIPAFSGLRDGFNVLAKELVEKSIIEGMLLFRSYEDAITKITDMRINS